ncbi:uncharacterized protein [Branchiostoma lanceolatum]|uniref:uncharacterized protein n=1 Tax=Branchiostoma lanceolatum TaxID=7740 RepID=UPI00345655BB
MTCSLQQIIKGKPAKVIFKPKTYIDNSTFERLDEYALSAPQSLNNDFKKLVAFLTKQAETELETVRAMFCWVAGQDVNNMTFPETVGDGSPDWFLKEMKEKMMTDLYPGLFNKLCRLAGIQCHVVDGYVKTKHQPPGTRFQDTTPNGKWNIVLIDGCWGIIDTHLGSTNTLNTEHQEPAQGNPGNPFNDFYFLPHPLHYLSGHYPENPVWQLIQSPVSLEDFERHIQCRENFAANQLTLLSHHRGVVPTREGEANIYIGVKHGVKMHCSLKNATGESTWKTVKLSRFVKQEARNGAAVFTVRPPTSGDFILEVFSSSDGSNKQRVCEYLIRCLRPMKDNKPFPHWGGRWGPGSEMKSHGLTPTSHEGAYVDCRKGKATIEFNMARELSFRTKLFQTSSGNPTFNRYAAHEIVDDVVRFKISAPEVGMFGLAIFVKEPETSEQFRLVCSYIISADQRAVNPSPFPTVGNGLFGPMQPLFAVLGLSTKSHHSAFIACDTGEVDIRISMKQVLDVAHDLIWENSEKKLDLEIFVYREILDREVRFLVRLLRFGKYRFTIYADGLDHEGDLPSVYNYCIVCKDRTTREGPFPPVSGTQWGRRFPAAQELLVVPKSHPKSDIDVAEALDIEMQSENPVDFKCCLYVWKAGIKPEYAQQFIKHQTNDGGTRTVVQMTFPQAGSYSLELFAASSGSQYRNVMNYHIRCHQPSPVSSPFNKSIEKNDEDEVEDVVPSFWAISSEEDNPKEAFKAELEREIEEDADDLDNDTVDKGDADNSEERESNEGAQDDKTMEDENVNNVVELQDIDPEEENIENVEEHRAMQIESAEGSDTMEEATTKEVENVSSEEEHQLAVQKHQNIALNPDVQDTKSEIDPKLKVEKLIASLTAAISMKNRSQLEELLEQLKGSQLDKEDETIIREAETLLKQLEVRQALRYAVASKLTANLETAIASAEPFASDVQDDLQEAKTTLSLIKLAEAISTNDRDQLEKLLPQLKGLQVDEEGETIIREAKVLLKQMDVRQELRDAITSKLKVDLESAIYNAEPFQLDMQEDLQEAKGTLSLIIRLEKLRRGIQQLNLRTLAEIRGYVRPPPAVLKVMTATLLLLGNINDKEKDWSTVKRLMGGNGRGRLIHRVNELIPADITPAMASGAQDQLKNLTLDDVTAVSTGAAAFYVWAAGMINEAEQEASSLEGAVSVA